MARPLTDGPFFYLMKNSEKSSHPSYGSRPFGAHMSIAGGVENAPARAKAVHARSIQIFTKNNNRWVGKPLGQNQIADFFDSSKKLGVDVFASHDCYLINLASPNKDILTKSRIAFLDEMDRADALKIPCLVFHPGAHTGSGEDTGVKKVAESIDYCVKRRPKSRVTLTIETTAGQGTNLGYNFEQIAKIIERSDYPEKLGVCVDTCHIFAAGYDITSKKGFNSVFKLFDKIIGLEKLKMFHLNDSKKGFGSRVDRHEHIGKGFIGLEGFRLLVNDERFKKTPMILETPKGPDGAEDIVNLRVLSGLIGRKETAGNK
ncbi:Endonuclease IV [hydrothermal vent metagenome]|uniref:Endonuclease IV n=1 Tax=hydrothermal vent metagenome TaxID=652676 RepID=A0A3B1BYW7_9ZZZZ